MITDHYSLVEWCLGVLSILVGISFLFNPKMIPNYVDLFLSEDKQDQVFIHLIALWFLGLGVLIVAVHNDWHMGLSLITTLIGWVWIIKCFLWLAFPKYLRAITKKLAPFFIKPMLCMGYSVMAILLGVAILWNHF